MKASHIAVLCLGAFAAAGSAQASTFGFDDFTVPHGVPFTGTYSEDGYSIVKTGGNAVGNQLVGFPTPSLGVLGTFNGAAVPFGELELTRDGGGFFTFASMDLRGAGNLQNYRVTGLAGGGTVFDFSADYAFGDYTITNAFASSAIDVLRFRFDQTNSASMVLDNIVLDVADAPAVPEPATWAMMLTGFGAMGYALRRRKVGFGASQAA